MPAKKWWRTMSWLKIPPRTQKNFAKNIIRVACDMEKFTCYDFRVSVSLLRDVLGFSGEIDSDNSNVEHSKLWDYTLTRSNTPNGHAYMCSVSLPWFKALPIFSVEHFESAKAKRLDADGNITFYAAFFVFKEILSEQALETVSFYEKIVQLSGIQKKIHVYKRSQIDIHIDVRDVPVSQKWMTDYIRPHKTSKQVVKPHNYLKELGWFQSLKYLAKIKTWVWIRIYNKCLDIVAKTKQSWYPHINAETDTVTRIELMYFSPFAENDNDTIFGHAKKVILWLDTWVTLCEAFDRPKSVYSPLSAHTYLTRYAKNHGISLEQLLCEVSEIQNREKNFEENFEENCMPNGSW